MLRRLLEGAGEEPRSFCRYAFELNKILQEPIIAKWVDNERLKAGMGKFETDL